MSLLLDEIKYIESSALKEIDDLGTSTELEELRIKYIGRKGKLTQLLKDIQKAPVEERPQIGKISNQLKFEITDALKRKASELHDDKPGQDVFDHTLPGRWNWTGKKHPLTQLVDEVKEIFRGMGFSLVTGPDIETDYYNFEALNFPKDHPARDMQDTFKLKSKTSDDYVLRTQTSSVQVRVMERTTPPIRVIAPGRCYRKDQQDATHSPVFHQIEGLYVDRNVTFAQLKGTLLTFVQKLFGKDIAIRFRPGYFPFTEPSAEYDILCVMCKGDGCRICKGTGWLEISGAGMVDPEVFKSVGYDPEECTGFAFGMGIERLAMVKYGINDIRLFFENDVRFLNQF